MRLRVRLTNVLLPLLALSGCAGGMASTAPATAAAAETAPSARAGYTLGAGDKLRITVFGEESLTGEYLVSDTGRVAFPLIGDVAAGGGTPAQLQETLRGRLASGYLKDPRVSVEIISYRPFYILGEVNKPGEYPYTNGLTLQQAVATAGGFTYRANTKRIGLKHAMETTERPVELRSTTLIEVQPGDTIRILERFF